MFFADDSLVFFKATREECLQIRRCLLLYERASGQMVNFDKSASTFGRNTSSQVIEDITSILSVGVTHSHELYLEARYFRNLDIMMAKVGHNPSYVWRSLLRSKDLIQKGLCWRVGNGRSIAIFTHQWVPNLPVRCGVNRVFDLTLKVEKLIDSDGSWNEIHVRSLVKPFDANAMLQIPLHRRGGEHFRYWVANDNGRYSVKSRYHLVRNSFSPPPFQLCYPWHKWWNMVWKLNVPPKIRIFLWRASWDYLHTVANLRSKYVPTDGFCSLCRLDQATTCHCLFFCPKVKQVWKDSIFWIVLKECKLISFVDCCMAVWTEWGRMSLNIFVVMCRVIWIEYCKNSHDHPISKESIKASWAVPLMEAFEISSLSDKCINVAIQSRSDKVWKRPLLNQFREDVDAGVDVANDKVSVGVVV